MRQVTTYNPTIYYLYRIIKLRIILYMALSFIFCYVTLGSTVVYIHKRNTRYLDDWQNNEKVDKKPMKSNIYENQNFFE